MLSTKIMRGQDDAKHFLEQGCIVASINYRLLKTTNETLGIRKCIQDAKDAVAHIRSLRNNYGNHASTQNITNLQYMDPDRVALWGSSAGAGIAMLIGFDDDAIGNPIKAIWVDVPQATYDIVKWHSSTGVFPSCNQSDIINLLTAPYIKSLYGIGAGPINFGNLQVYRDEVDILRYIDNATDPPIWIDNIKPANNVTVTCPGNKTLLNHHINHCITLRDTLEYKSVEWHLRLRDLANNSIVITRSAGGGNWSSGVEFIMSKF